MEIFKCEDMLVKISEQAVKNIATWGLQDNKTLVAAMTEEIGEVARAVLEDKPLNICIESVHLAALCAQIYTFNYEKRL